MKSIQQTANGLAAHLAEAMSTIADLPDQATLASFLTEGLRYQFGAATTDLQALHENGGALIPVVDTPVPPTSAGAMTEQVGGNHYKEMKIQHAEFCQVNGIPWCESAAIKYLCRHKRKAGLQDLQKAVHYIRLAAKLTYNAEI